MKNSVKNNSKIHNILIDINKLSDKNIDFLPFDIPLLIRTSHNPTLNNLYKNQAIYKNNLFNFHRKILFYSKIKKFNDDKYNDYYNTLNDIIFKKKLNYDIISYIMEYLYFDENTFMYQEFVNIYQKNHIINSQINILKFGLFFMNTYFELFNNDELKELYKRFSLLQTEFNNYNDIKKTLSIPNKLLNIMNTYDKEFPINFSIERFINEVYLFNF